MSSRLVNQAMNSVEQYGPPSPTPRSFTERTIRVLEHGSAGGGTAQKRIVEAWLCSEGLRDRYLRDARFHAAINVMAQLASLAVFEDMPLTHDEINVRAKSIDLVTGTIFDETLDKEV